MTELLLTHGYFLAEDEKERAIMKPYPPLGLLYLSAFLKARGIAVEVFDSTFSERDDLLARLHATPGGVLGIYSNLMTRGSVLKIISAAKDCGWRVILGGPESANYVAEYLNEGADVIVIGEGELALTELVAVLGHGGRRGLEAIAGIAFIDEQGRIVETPERPKIRDLDTLPFPDRAAIDHQKYLDAWKTHHGASSINLITARGCPYRCNWCSHAVYGYSHRRRSPENVADELQEIVDRYDPDQVWYADDVFTISHPWMERYVKELERRRIHRPFETITRADRLQTRESVEMLKKLGCYRIWIGSESGSQRILDAMDRGVTVEQVRKSTKLAQDHGIEVGMFLMWGYEGEEIEDIAATVEHVKLSNPDIFFTTVTYPIKGTGYFEKVSNKVALPTDWAKSSDRDYVIADQQEKSYYKLADRWLRSEVEAARIEATDPERAAELLRTAADARSALERHTSA
ncbi:MAG TPA: radical SAM protein [Gammaproteobacteria bacterium]|nr:radical SAM protein [Gammaproteobacteria bacterium]